MKTPHQRVAVISTLFVVLACVFFGAELRRPSAAPNVEREDEHVAASPASAPELLWMNGAQAGGVGKAALSPDGQILATADYAEVLLWRYADGQLIRTIGVPLIGDVKCIRFTPDGQHVIAGGTWIPGQTVATLRMWRVADGTHVRDFATTKDVRSISLTADGRLLAASIGGGEPGVTLFDVATGGAVRSFGPFAANAVAVSRDGFVAAAGADEFGAPPSVTVWRASDGLQVAKLFGLNFITDSVAFAPDGRYLAAGDWASSNGVRGKVTVWLVPAFIQVQSLTTPSTGSIYSLAFTPDSQSIAAGGTESLVNVWHLPDGTLTKTVNVNINHAIWNIIFSDNDTFFASGAQNTSGVWRVSDNTQLRTFGAERAFVTSVAFAPDGANLITSNGRGINGTFTVEMFRASDGALARSFAAHNDIINSVAFAPDGARVASASGSGPPDTRDTRIFLSPVAAGGSQLTLPGHTNGTVSVAFSPDSQLLVSGGRDNLVRLWRVSDGTLVRAISGHTNWVHSVAFSPDGQLIASGSGDSKVKLWRVADGALVRTIDGTGFPVGSIAFSPDGTKLALTAFDAIQLRRVSDGATLRTISVEAGFGNLGNVIFSRDGSVVAVANGSYPPTLRFWRVADGALVKSYNRETGWVQPPSLALSPDGTKLGLGRYDAVVALARFPVADAGGYVPAYEGQNEATDCDFITGWAWDANQPDGTVNVDIYDGATLIATVPANQFRQDLYDGGKGNGYHGFKFTIPASFKNGTPHTLAVKFSGTNTDLTGSPRSITCGTPPLPGTWTGAAPMPTARRSFAVGVINGRVYAAGGDANNDERGTLPNILGTHEAYDTATNTWTTRASLPTPRVGPAGAAVGGKFYVLGGWSNDYSTGTDPYRNTVEVYDAATNTWGTAAPMPRARYYLAAATIGGKLYAVGGYDPSVGYTTELTVYDPATNGWMTLAPMPTGRYALAAVALNGKLYAVGGTCAGCGSPPSGYSRDLEVYDPASNSWARLAPMPTGRYGLAAGVINGKIYVVGGYRNGLPDAVEVYDPATDTWATTASLPTPREYLSAAVVGANLYAIGGEDAAHVVRNTVEVFTPGAQPSPTPTPTPVPTPATINVALATNGGTVTVSSTYDSRFPASALNNGDRRGLNWGTGGGWNDATANNYPDWVQVEFAGPKTLQEIDLFTVQDNFSSPAEPTAQMTFTKYGVTGLRVESWNGSAWSDVPGAQLTSTRQVWNRFTFPALTTTKIRVVINGALDGYSRLVEVEAWGTNAATSRVNVAAAANGATANASSQYDSRFPVSSVINGDRKGLNWGSGGGWNDATANAYPDSLEISFSGEKTISEVDLFTVQDNFSSPAEPTETMTFTKYGVTAFQIQYWTGTAWATIPNATAANNNSVWRKFTFTPLTTSKIRVVITGALDGYSRLVEVEAY